MIKKLFFLLFGLGFGLVIGLFVMRRMDEAAQSVAPSNLASQAGRAAGTFASRMRDAWEETKTVAAEREAELRAEYHVPRARDLLGG